MRILRGCIVGFVVGALLGAIALPFLFTLTGLPYIIRHADWGNNFPPTVFLASMVMFGYVGATPIGAAIGAVTGFIIGGIKGSQRPDTVKPKGVDDSELN